MGPDDKGAHGLGRGENVVNPEGAGVGEERGAIRNVRIVLILPQPVDVDSREGESLSIMIEGGASPSNKGRGLGEVQNEAE